MKKLSEMTNAELVAYITGPSQWSADFKGEMVKRLRAMPEPPEPEFCVGWEGKTRGGRDAEILAIRHGDLYGIEGTTPRCWKMDGGSRYCDGSDLIPNTQKPEIWWRRPSKPDQLYFGILAHDRNAGNFEKVSVQVIK